MKHQSPHRIPRKWKRLLKSKYRYDLSDSLKWEPPRPASSALQKTKFVPECVPGTDVNVHELQKRNTESIEALTKKYAQDIENGRNIAKRFNQ